MSTSHQDTCGICHDPLVIEAEEAMVIDDVQLLCGHHFHWSCYEERDNENPGKRAKCPSCSRAVLSDGKLLVTIRNEGGIETGVDLGSILDEEKLVDSNPHLKMERAFLGLVNANRDFEAAKDLLDHGVDVNCRYEDGMTALHLSAGQNDVEGIRFLLEHGANKSMEVDGRSPLQLLMTTATGSEADYQEAINLLS